MLIGSIWEITFMKHMFVLVSISLMVFACNKSGESVNSNENPLAEKKENPLVGKKDNQLTGKWRNISSWMNPGGGPDIIRTPASNDLFVEFKSNGVFSSNLPEYDFDSYKLSDDQKVTFTQSSNGNNIVAVISLVSDTLRLSRLDCIEGCGHAFVPYE